MENTNYEYMERATENEEIPSIWQLLVMTTYGATIYGDVVKLAILDINM